MHKRGRKIRRIISFLILIVLIWGGIHAANEKKMKWEELNKKIAEYKEESLERVNKSVFTLPEGSTIVGLVDGKGTYKSEALKKNGTVTVEGDLLVNRFVDGIYGKVDPRQDVVVPVYVSTDSYGGSMYVVLYQDRGDAAIEKSYARLGGNSVLVDSIKMLDKEKDTENYRVEVIYKSSDLSTKKVTIPVVDGHFDPSGTVTQ